VHFFSSFSIGYLLSSASARGDNRFGDAPLREQRGSEAAQQVRFDKKREFG
jgi:hypothetical protein